MREAGNAGLTKISRRVTHYRVLHSLNEITEGVGEGASDPCLVVRDARGCGLRPSCDRSHVQRCKTGLEVHPIDSRRNSE